MNRNELIEYASSRYGAQPEYLWKRYPNYFVLRHPLSKKWFAVIMDVPMERLGIPDEGRMDIMDVKCGPILLGSYRERDGFLPAYHMNKENWISVRLDGIASDEDIALLLGTSFELTE